MLDDKTISILLVEDSHTQALMVDMWLHEGLGSAYQLHTAETLGEGIEILGKVNVDLVILDLNLPDSEGLDTFRRLQGKSGEIPIVIMSSESDQEVAITAVSEGAQEYVVKGTLDDNVIIRPIRYAIERSRRQRAEDELRRTQREILLARTVQRQLSPDRPPVIEGYDVAGRCEAARTAAGDYFDSFPMSAGRWGFVVGDVSGHDLSSNLLMVGARAVIHTLVTLCQDVGEILTRANSILYPDMGDGRFLTAFLMSLEPTSRSFRFAAAGHQAHLLDADGNLRLLLESQDQPLGIDQDVRYACSPPVELSPGETVLMCTDGIADTRSTAGEFFGQSRVFELAKQLRHESAFAQVQAIFAAAEAFRGAADPSDDATLVVLRVTP